MNAENKEKTSGIEKSSGAGIQHGDALFRQFAETLPQIVWIARPDGYHEYFNGRWYEYTGRETEEAIGEFWSSALHPDDLDRWRHSLESGEPYEIEVRLQGSDGGYRWFLAQGRPLRDETGRIVRWFGTCTGIHAQKEAQAALRESEERFRQLADAMPQLVWTADPDGTVDYYNRRTEEFAGFSRDPDGRWHWHPVVHPEDAKATTEAWEKAVRTGGLYQIAHRVKRADGSFGWYLSRAIPVRDEEGRIVKWYGTATDIHELRETQEQLREANEQLEKRVAERTAELERANRELDAFNYSISHDLRAPLRTIDGFSRALLEDYADRLDETGRDYLRRVRSAAQRMGVLIDEQLRLSRIGRTELRRETVDLSTLAAEIAEELTQRDPDRTVEWVIGKGLTACGDRELLKIALDNLLGNAWKFTGKVPRGKIEFNRKAGEEPVFFVRDNGSGFDMAHAQRLFIPYQRLHSEQEFPGTGIGATIVQRIIDRHGGRVWAEGGLGEGATFYFTLDEGK